MRRRRTAVLCAVAAALSISVTPGPLASGSSETALLRLRSPVITAPAVRGPLRKTVRLTGRLESADKVIVRSGCQWPVQLVEIVPEGTYVEEGGVVARLNTAGIWPHEQRTRIDMVKIQKWATGAKERLQMQELINAGRMARTRLQLELAELDLIAFVDGQMPRDRNKQAGALELAREAVLRSRDRFEHERRMAQKGYSSPSDVEAERIKVKRAEHNLTTAMDNLKLLVGYQQNRTLTALQAAVDVAREELDRAESECAILMRTKRIDHLAAEKTLLKQESYLRMFDDANEGCELRAPRAGRVVHARGLKVNGGRPPQPGDWIHLRQAIVELPRFDALEVHVRIPESQVRHVTAGRPVEIRVDARPYSDYVGTVKEVATLPTLENSPNEDRRSYTAVISLDVSAAEAIDLQPGLTASARVIVDTREDCVQVPPLSTAEINGETVVFVREDDGVRVRPVTTGLRTITATEVLDGVEPDEEVVVSPRSFLTEELIALRGEDATVSDEE